jgi:hypothetical protein
MTVRHVVLFRWRPEVTSEDIAAVDAALDALPAQVPTLRGYHHGPDLGLGDGRWDYGIVAECDDVEGWQAYEEHPAHQQVVSQVIRPRVADRAAVQIGPVH